MSHELQALIPQRRQISYKLIYDSLNENFFNPINILGAVNSAVVTYYSITCKNPHDKICLSDANRTGIYAGLSAAYLMCFLKLLQNLSEKYCPMNILEVINILLNQMMQILNNHTFYLLAASAIAAASADSNTISNRLFWGGVFPIVLGFTTLSHTPQIRYKIRELCCHYPQESERGLPMKILDMGTAFLEGGTTMISTISSIAQIHDYINELKNTSSNSWIYSTPGMTIRYSLGGMWGLFQLGLRNYYPAYVTEDEALRSRLPSISQSLLSTITLCILTGFAISMTTSADFATLISLCFGLMLFSLTITCNQILKTISQNFNQFHHKAGHHDTSTSARPIAVEVIEEADHSDQSLLLPAPENQPYIQEEINNTTRQIQKHDDENQDQIIAQKKNNTANFYSYKISHLLNSILFYKIQPDDNTMIKKNSENQVKKDILRENIHVPNYARNP